ncbi:hypothetical protein EH31_15675 [Erythrobacter longus]|uniref:Uncharacterized protein n=1 Tax=Erythrobacter longus TaxID=1044 RepID=A0A074M7Z2_ERYLO|nr:hypothetical protein [Erythrobacter longus]KEO88870.1 hypothetical protein EH31_15675 [Erythrobacter longus]
MNADTAKPGKAAGFLGRGPLFWIGMTFGTSGAVVGLVLSGAIEGKATAFTLMIVPLACMAAAFMSMLNKNEAGTGDCVTKGQAQRNYIKRVAVLTSLYLASFAALTFLDRLGDLPYAVRLGVGVLPGLAVAGFFWAIGRLILEETDEFMRMLTIRQTLVASALAMSAASVWGMLESADLVPHIDAYWYAIIWFAGLALGSVVNRITYGTWGHV